MTNDGLPLGYEAHTQSLSLEPVLLAISPKTGSSAGTLVTVTGSGFGVNTAGLGLYYEKTTLTTTSEIVETSFIAACIEIHRLDYG